MYLMDDQKDKKLEDFMELITVKDPGKFRFADELEVYEDDEEEEEEELGPIPSKYFEGFTQVERNFSIEISDFYDDEDESTEEEEPEDEEEDVEDNGGPLTLKPEDEALYNITSEMIKQAINNSNSYLRNHRIECAPLTLTMNSIENMLKVRFMANEYVRYTSLEKIVNHLEKMYLYINNLDSKIHEYADSDVDALQKKAILEKMMDVNDGNILKLDEGIIKIWNLIPKTKVMEDLLLKLEKVSASMYELAGSYVEKDNISLRYFSLNLINDNRNKIVDEYEYLPFVRKVRAKEYKEELDGLKKSLDMTKIHYIGIISEIKNHLQAIEYEQQDCNQALENWNLFAKNNKKQSRERLIELEEEENQTKAKLDAVEREYEALIKDISDNIDLCESKYKWYQN